jgi:glycosyltransferase involved in cell wall biosynthesis
MAQKSMRVDATVIPPALRTLPDVTVAREDLILGVGRLHAAKGFDLLLRAYARIAAAIPTWRLAFDWQRPAKIHVDQVVRRIESYGWRVHD